MNKFLLAAAICWTATLSAVADAQTTGQYTVSTALNTPGNLNFSSTFHQWGIYPWEGEYVWGGIYGTEEVNETYSGSIGVSKFDDNGGSRILTSAKLQIYEVKVEGDWSLDNSECLFNFTTRLSIWRDSPPVISQLFSVASFDARSSGIFPHPSNGALEGAPASTSQTYTSTQDLAAFTGPEVFLLNWEGLLDTNGEVALDPVNGGVQTVFSGFVSITYYFDIVP